MATQGAKGKLREAVTDWECIGQGRYQDQDFSYMKLKPKTGRTHQIRVHLAHIGHPIVGDEQYGSRTQSKRILLHSAKMKILDYEFNASEPKDIARYK